MPVGIKGDLVTDKRFLALDPADRWCYTILGMNLVFLGKSSHRFNHESALEAIGMSLKEFNSSVARLVQSGLVVVGRKGSFRLVDDSKHFCFIEEPEVEPKKQEQPKPPKPKKKHGAVKQERAERIFSFWRNNLPVGKARLTPKRKKKIEDRLKDGYSEQEIKKAITGCSLSPFHMGDNENETFYVDLELICRSSEKLEYFIRIAEQKAPQQMPQKQESKRSSMLERVRKRPRSGHVEELEVTPK